MSSNLCSADEQGLKQLEMSWDDALARRDASLFSELIADDYQVADINGAIRSKSEVLNAIAAADPRIKPYRRYDVDVRLYGDMAVITGGIIWKGSNGKPNGGSADSYARYLKVYVKRDDEWRVIAARATRIAGDEQ